MMKSSTSGFSFSKLALSTIRRPRKIWPFSVGKDLPNHLGAVATRMGLIHPAWFEFRPGLWMQLNVTDLIQETILLEGLWDPSLTNFIESNLKPGDVFIDVGAHVGYFTLLAARRVGAEGNVLAIEPNPNALSQLEQNVQQSDLENVLIEQAACGDSDGSIELFLNTESNTSMASLSPTNATGAGSVKVSCTRVDELLEKHGLRQANLVKIDVEGAELGVLRGMKKTMNSLRPIIVLELEPALLKSFGTTVDEIMQLFESCNYSVTPLGGHSNFACHPLPNR